MTPIPPLILASTSPYRRALLARLGLAFESRSPGIAEDEQPGEAPPARAARLALAKARAAAAACPGAIVIGSDQVASLGAGTPTLLHKPGDRETCHRQLAAMSGQTVQFDTALAVVRDNVVLEHLDTTLVHFRDLDAAAIESYMDREPAFDCAGGFKCEGLGVTLFEAIETRDPTALVGLPLIAVCAALRQLGVAA